MGKSKSEAVVAGETAAAVRGRGGMLLSDLFAGEERAGIRESIVKTGQVTQGKKTLYVQTRPIDGGVEHEILAIAAVARDPGRSDSYLDAIQDFKPTSKSRQQLVDMYWNLYKNEGIVNNAVNKIAATLSGGGEFRVRKAKRGKKQGQVDTLQELLYWWTENVNRAALDGVVTGARGLKAVTQQGVRRALVEGSWVGRMTWTSVDVPGLGRFDLPMNIQSLNTGQLTPVKQVTGTPIELFDWTPPRALVQELKKPTDKDAGKLLKKFFDKDVTSQLVKDGKARLDAALLLHAKHRGNDDSPFGESFIQSALTGIRYRRAIEQADLVSMENVINRLTIVMVGSSDSKSPYSKPDVAAARQALMQSFFEDPGPNMTIVWSGDDVDVKDVGAHSTALALDKRHEIGDSKVKVALGVPDSILNGTLGEGGKASGLAANMGMSAELDELQTQFQGAWKTVGERIAFENGFTDIDLVYEFDRSLWLDRSDEMNQARNHYTSGLFSIRTTLQASGRDPDAEFMQMCKEKGLEPDTATWVEAFAPPQGLQGQGAGKVPGNGRTPDGTTGKTTKERPPERKSPKENK